MKLSNIKRIHFIGIGGVGMVGIAEMLINQGFNISGSDLVKNKNTSRLHSLGAKIFIGHNEKNVRDADVVVYSSAVSQSNPEMKAAKSSNTTLIPRAEMLSSLMRGFQSIAVAGSHGKTTTTSLIADIFIRAKLDPTFIIGGKILGQENKSILGSSEYLIVEADESDASFLHLNPEISVVTNIDNDHLDFYANDLEKLDSTFLQFLENLPFYGNAIICIDSERSKAVYEKLSRPKISYGFDKKADYFIKELKQNDVLQEFIIVKNSTGKEISLKLALAGRHNALNATAAFIVSQKAGINIKIIKESFMNFGGVSRRMEHKGEIIINKNKVKLIDDYGHHPTEIKATIDAVKATNPKKKISMIFQPHRFSRSIFLFDEFIECLSELDNVVILDIYSAGEQNQENISAYSFVNALVDKGKNAFFAKNLKQICKHLDSIVGDEEILITQGAGNIVDISNSIRAIYK
ncbi:MAG: UDP-N-acetylmuramate--L-alanine ligase [Gammaproteobacteria bacterium]